MSSSDFWQFLLQAEPGADQFPQICRGLHTPGSNGRWPGWIFGEKGGRQPPGSQPGLSGGSDLLWHGAVFLGHLHLSSSAPHLAGWASSSCICGTLRLARFNIVSGKSDQFFEGLPIPAAGIALSASVLLGRPTLTIVLMLFLALLMVSSISYPKIRDLRRHDRPWRHLSCGGIVLFWQQNDILYASSF